MKDEVEYKGDSEAVGLGARRCRDAEGVTDGNSFVWGAATAAFQIEGATKADGRGESIWDRFATVEGNVAHGDTGEPACEHYYRWRDDLDLMRSLGIEGYRFSISWPRIQPAGRGPANQRGLDFYRSLVEGLLERGISPLATLYHWDLPQALQDEGGWASREVVDRFAEYARIAFDALGDVVPAWITHNEPWVTSILGYAYGVKAPGIRDWPTALRAAHHSLLAHGMAVEAFRETGRDGEIGITLDLTVAIPATDSETDRDAAGRLDGHHNRWFLDPIFRASYPEDMVTFYEGRFGPLDAILDGDLKTIAQPLDFLGINFYRPNWASAVADGGLDVADAPPDLERTSMGWPIAPEYLADLLVRVQSDYGEIPLLITENGAAFDDVIDGTEVVEDPHRVAYLREHIAAVQRAKAEGVDIRGYYVWSLLDNFEWEYGYEKRFGIVFVDFPTQRRIPKRSALWYRDLISEANGRE
jgi:beta-glucosidase